MSTPSLAKAIRTLLEPEIAGGLSAYEDVEILLAAWKELHAERALVIAVSREMVARPPRDPFKTKLANIVDALDAYDTFTGSDGREMQDDIIRWERELREALNV